MDQNKDQRMMDKGLDTLQVWKAATQFALYICKDLLPGFPTDEKWALVSQLRRSAQSIPANIAEGYGRYYYQETIRFCYIARGSLEEAYSHLCLAKELGYLNDQVFEKLIDQIQTLRRSINGYILYLKKSRRGENEPGMKTFREDSVPYLFSIKNDQIQHVAALDYEV
jgi:four helix bundle protein